MATESTALSDAGVEPATSKVSLPWVAVGLLFVLGLG